MNTVSCPTCGAPVAFRSAASVMAVCDYCKSTLIKDADSVRNVGRMADVLEDYSPIRIDTSGSIDEGSGQRVGFVVVGRLQLRYDAGFWNEWYVLDDAGRGGWLSDASGNYVFTREADPARWAAVSLPPFERIAPGGPLDLGQASDGSRLVFIVGDVREARCTGGQGELPFVVGSGYTARVADFHRGADFITLDYSDVTSAALPTAPVTTADGGAPRPATPVDLAGHTAAPRVPTVYQGRAVTLDELKPQLLRDPDTIQDEAGRFKGKVDTLACPSCGAAIPFSPGATSYLLCPTCHATIDVTSSVAEVIAAAKRVDAVQTTLALGAKATIAAVGYTVIGLMRRAEISTEGSVWTEYLLYAPQKGFVWLIETSEGWERSAVVDVWPYWVAADLALLDGVGYRKLYDFNAVVQYAAGAFNWKVAVGDVTRITEFQAGAVKLAAESTPTELTWSQSMPVSPQELAMWFAKPGEVPVMQPGPPSLSAPPVGGYRRVAKWLTVLLIAVNAIPVLFSPGRTLVVVILAVVGLWLPAWFMDSSTNRRD
jgi:uncharacterized protein (DUF983 family)